MFSWLQRMSPDVKGLEEINEHFLGMLDDGRHMFDAAANALLGGTDPQVIREDLFATDRRINETEQEIRRQIVVHGTVHGATTFPALLVMMSLVKDAERIGDYAKNVFDLTVKVGRIPGEQERAELVELKDKTSKLLIRLRNVYHSQEARDARQLTWDADVLADQCDAAAERLLNVEGANMAAAVLAYRYFKRTISHVSNIATSVFMPLHLLDFYDEPPGD